MMANSNTMSHDLPPLPPYTLHPVPPLIPGIPDSYLCLALPVIAYWAVSLIFHVIDELDLFPQYRLHTPEEVLKRNRASRWDVFRDVIIQQAIQTAFGMVLTWIDKEPTTGKEHYDIAWWAQNIRLSQRVIPTVLATIGVDVKTLATNLASSHAMLAGAISGGVYPDLTQTITVLGEQTSAPAFASWELLVAKAICHAGIPFLKFVLAICIVDTWQYFMHRAFHMNKYLYTTIHSRHHRLYVPYAYGALYNHPLEGLFMDTCGAGVGYLVSGMTVRQSMWFFTMSTIKTVDDHCGYVFPWDPLQHLTSNNAGYHDVHHQSWGIKTNFSQPFFTFWDAFMGTKWTGGDVSARFARTRNNAQKELSAHSVTSSSPTESVRNTATPYEKEASNASSTARAVHRQSEPRVPPGTADLQAIGSRQQVLDDSVSGGVEVLTEESVEEAKARQRLRQSPRKRNTSSGLKGFADRVGDSLHGKGTGVLGLESGSRR